MDKIIDNIEKPLDNNVKEDKNESTNIKQNELKQNESLKNIKDSILKSNKNVDSNKHAYES